MNKVIYKGFESGVYSYLKFTNLLHTFSGGEPRATILREGGPSLQPRSCLPKTTLDSGSHCLSQNASDRDSTTHRRNNRTTNKRQNGSTNNAKWFKQIDSEHFHPAKYSLGVRPA